VTHPNQPTACAADAGKQTVNTMFGTRVAVLAGDFLFAQASWLIANLENLEVRSSVSSGRCKVLIRRDDEAGGRLLG
jgi:all-trans-nonaprenyl-diphosphate synthase